MLTKIIQILISIKNKSNDLLYGRELIASWSVQYAKANPQNNPIRILDFGCGNADDLNNIKNHFTKNGLVIETYGIECFPPCIERATKSGVTVRSANIETDPFPFPDQYFDIIISNQTVEHTKEIFWIFSEVSRTLKSDGIVITGAPNLASFHNRILLLFGEQPSSIEMLGPHVRGFTFGSFKKFIETDSYFEVLDKRGSHFYPFPRSIAIFLSRLLPTASASLFIMAKRTDKPGQFKDVLKTRFFATPYFVGQK